MRKQQQGDVKGHVARNGRYEAQARAGGVPRAWPSSPRRRLLPLPAWPGCMCRGLESPGTCLGLVYMDALDRQLAGPRAQASTLQKVLRNTLARGTFPKEFHYTQHFAKVLHPSTLKNNLAPEAKWRCTSGRWELGPRPVWA